VAAHSKTSFIAQRRRADPELLDYTLQIVVPAILVSTFNSCLLLYFCSRSADFRRGWTNSTSSQLLARPHPERYRRDTRSSRNWIILWRRTAARCTCTDERLRSSPDSGRQSAS